MSDRDTRDPSGRTEAGPIARHLAGDHARLDAILAASVAEPDAFARAPYDAFRSGLLRHISVEEKLLFPAVRAAGADDATIALLRRLRVDHGALASLLVPTPSRAIVLELRKILAPHDALEDAPGGLYDRCDALLGDGAAALVERMRAHPPVKVARYSDGPRVLRTAEDALRASARQRADS